MVEGSVAESRYSPAVPQMWNKMIPAAGRWDTVLLAGCMVTGFVNWFGGPAAVVYRVMEMATAAVGGRRAAQAG